MIWRKILTEHPALLEILLPGNEAVLTTARSKHPELERAFQRHGPPPPDLIAELLGTASGKAAARQLPALQAALGLNVEEKAQFAQDGFVIIRSAVSGNLVHDALRHINSCIGRGAVDRSVPILVGLPLSESSSAAITALFSGAGSRLPHLCQSLLGNGNVRGPSHGQVALRFPVTGSIEAAAALNRKKLGGRAWHIDGFGDGAHSPFTLLCGVCLSDQPASGGGNFAVHPGAHWSLQEKVRAEVAAKGANFSRMDSDDSKPDLGEPVQLGLQAGDVVLAHQKLPHLGVPNTSHGIRYQVYFRIMHICHDALKDKWLDDMMLPFEGLRADIGI